MVILLHPQTIWDTRLGSFPNKSFDSRGYIHIPYLVWIFWITPSGLIKVHKHLTIKSHVLFKARCVSSSILLAGIWIIVTLLWRACQTNWKFVIIPCIHAFTFLATCYRRIDIWYPIAIPDVNVFPFPIIQKTFFLTCWTPEKMPFLIQL